VIHDLVPVRSNWSCSTGKAVPIPAVSVLAQDYLPARRLFQSIGLKVDDPVRRIAAGMADQTEPVRHGWLGRVFPLYQKLRGFWPAAVRFYLMHVVTSPALAFRGIRLV